MAGPWEKYSSKQKRGPWDNYGTPVDPEMFPTEASQPEPEEPGMLRELADTGLSVGKGAVGLAESVTNVFGADNPASRGLNSTRKYLGSLESDQQQDQRRQHAQRMLEAEATGSMWEEGKTAVKNFLEDPIDYAAEGAGSLVGFAPLKLIGTGAKVLGLSARTTAAAGLGAASGVGSVKGQQYEMVKEAKLKEGYSPEEAEAAAVQAQSYNADNAVDLLTGGVLGAVAGSTGAESLMLGAGRMAGKGLAKRAATGVLTETPFEAMQGGQERLAGNRALAREGYDVDPWQGVVGQGVTEGIMSAPVGGVMGAAQGYTPTQTEIDEHTRQMDEQARASQQRESQAIMQAERDAIDAQVAEEQAQQEAEATRARRVGAAKQYPFADFEPLFKDEVAARKAEEKALTEQARQLYGEHVAAADPTQPLPDLKTFTKQHLAENGVTGEKLDIRQEYVNYLDAMAEREAQAATDEASSTDYTQADGSGQMSFLDQVRGEGDSVLQFDPNLRGPIIDDEATQFENEQGGVNGYRGQLVNEPGTFENVVPRRDFGLTPPAPRTVPKTSTVVANPNTTPSNPITVGREAAVAAGMSQGAWTKFVSKYKLAGTDTDAVAEAIRDRAINGSGSNNSAWEAAHLALTGKSIDQHITEIENESTLQNTEVAQVPAVWQGQKTDAVPVQEKVGSLAPAGLSAGQQAVYDTMLAAAQNNEFDQFQQSDGKLNYTAIAQASGLKGKQAAYAAVKQAVDKVAEQLGTTRDGMKAFLANRTKQVRVTERAEGDMLGTSPDNFTKTSLQPGALLDNSDLFGNDEGGTAGFGTIESVGGSQGAVGENVQPTATDLARPDPVAEKRVAEALARLDAVMTEALAHPVAAEAAADWDDMRGSHAPFAKDLSRQDAYDWLMTYMELKNGDITQDQLAAEQRDIERRYDADPARAVVGDKRATGGGQGEQRALGEGESAPGTAAETQAEVDGQNATDEYGDAQALIDVVTQLQALAESDPSTAFSINGHKDFKGLLGRALNGGPDDLKAARAFIRHHASRDTSAETETEVDATAETDGAQALNPIEARVAELDTLAQQSFPPDKGGQGVMFSQAAATTGQDAATLREKMRKLFINPALFDKRVTVVQSEADLPAQHRNDTADSRMETVRGGLYETRTGNVYLIADNIPPGREFSVFMHEVGGHMGMRNLLGKANFDALYEQINTWAEGDGTIENEVAKAALARVLNAGVTTEGEVKEELIAYFVEEAVRRGIDPTAVKNIPRGMQQWFISLWNAVKSAVQKLGVNPATLTAKDVVDLAYGAARLELNGSQTDIDAAADAAGRPATDVAFVEPKADAAPVMNSISRRPADEATSAPQGIFAKAGNMIDAFMVDPKTALDAARLGWLTLEQMADRTKLASLRGYIDTIHKMQANSKDRVAVAAALDIEWAKLEDTDAAKLGDVMVRSTLMGYDPTTTAPANGDQVKLRADLQAVPGGEALYTHVRDFYTAANDEKKAILKAAALKAGKLPAEVDKMFAEIKGPYFPLMRTGDWYAVAMSDEVAELTDKQEEGEISAAEAKRLATLRKDPAQYMTRSFQSRSEAEKFAKQSGFPVTHVNTQRQRISRDVTSLPDFAKFESYIGKEFDTGTRSKLRDMMAEMYYDMLPQSSHLKQQMRREGVAGASFGRSEFARSAMSQAHMVSRLKFSDALAEAMLAVDKDARKGGIEARQIYNELQKRNALAMDNDAPPAWVDLAMKGSYFAHLGVSPAYWLTNATQVPMITLPWLAARHGLGNSTQALASAMADIKSIMKSSFDKGAGWRFEFDWKDRFPEGSGEAEMFRQLLERNKLDVTIEHDLMAVADLRHGKLNEVAKFLNTPVRSIELVNRGMTALAAYRLGMKKFAGDQQKAIDHAIKSVNDTQLDYSTLNAARHMQSVLGSKSLARLMMQFRKFQQGMIYLVATSAYDAVKGADLETRREARNTLFGLMTTTGLMAGSVGLPAAGTVMMIANLIGQAFDDDDEPFDADTTWRNFVVGHAGKDLGEVLLNGLPTLAGLDASKRVGMSDIFDPVPFFRQGANGRESANNMLAAVAGAPFGTLADTWDGIGKMANGDFTKGAEKIIPIKLAQNAIRAGRYSQEGMTDTRGNVVLGEDEFGPWDLTLRAMGFQTTDEATYYTANQAVNEAKYAARDVRTKLLNQLVDRDIYLSDGEVAAFNRRHPSNRITMKSVVASRRSRQQMARERTPYGVRRNKASRDYMDNAAFAEDE